MATLKRKTNNGYEPLPAMVVRKTNAENGNGIGTCSTSSGTALVVSLTNYELVVNGFIAVTFENDVPANATLNINSKGAKPIYYKGSAITADTIKADDTVMFCYDGTNYVVTSLGGGGGIIVWPEFVTIQLTQNGGSDSALIGATVVVTNDDTSAVILSTTWQGSDIAIQVDAGVDYTVTVGNVSNLYIQQNTQSYTAVSGITKIVTFKYIGGYVDLGLPSGTLWCTHNVGASTPKDYGSFFSWGNIEGHVSGDGYSFDTSSYATTHGNSLQSSFTSGDPTYDAARAIMGSPWRMPTYIEAQELLDNTDIDTSATIDGIAGVKYMKKTDHSIYIFIPNTGNQEGSGAYTYFRQEWWCCGSPNSKGQAATSYYQGTWTVNVNGYPPERGLAIHPVI